MTKDDFKPKLGRIRGGGRANPLRYTTRVIQETARNRLKALRHKSHINPNALKRGLAHGVISATSVFVPGTRRVIVRARYIRQTKGDLGAARAHLRYIQRDGTTREGLPGKLYDAGLDNVDAAPFLERSDGDPHQFRFIVSAEDSAQLDDLKPVVRDLVRQMEHDLGTKLDWVAVDHFNTGHPHTHIVIRGRDAQGADLVMARDYIGHGIRARAQDLVTLELGPETELERMAKRTNEVGQERLTNLDRGLLAKAKDNVLVIAAVEEADPARHTLRVGRLRKLEGLGLARERQAGVWELDAELETKLRRLGERADKIKMMQRALNEVGIERSPGTFAVFDRGTRKEPLVGKVVGTGFIDEITDRTWAVIDATDGRVHYVELGRLTPDTVPPRNAVVQITADRLEGKPQATPRLDIVARAGIEASATYDGPVWIDRHVTANDRALQTRAGFGAELHRAIEARRQWLVSQDLGRATSDGGFEFRTSTFARLRERELERIGADVAKRLGLPHTPAMQRQQIRGKVTETLDVPSGKIAVLQRAGDFTLVPWSKRLDQQRGHEIAGTVTSQGLVLGRGRGRVGPER